MMTPTYTKTKSGGVTEVSVISYYYTIKPITFIEHYFTNLAPLYTNFDHSIYKQNLQFDLSYLGENRVQNRCFALQHFTMKLYSCTLE